MEQDKHGQSPKWVRVSERLPERGRFVTYRTEKYIFAGHLDSEGNWIDAVGKRESNEVIDWLDE